jgi:hypothetical protein
MTSYATGLNLKFNFAPVRAVTEIPSNSNKINGRSREVSLLVAILSGVDFYTSYT